MNKELKQKVIEAFGADSPQGILPKQCKDLLNQQKNVWKELSDNYREFENVKSRELSCTDYKVILQYNPNRIFSTTANTDAQTIQSRECFLCIKNLPQNQQGILWQDKFLILCNPVPIFSYHYTISNILHEYQELERYLDELLALSSNLYPDFTLIYNGPECGASAPDHMHFQAIPRRKLPVENDAVDMKRRKRLYYKNHVAVSTLANYGRMVLIVESSDKSSLIKFLNEFFLCWKKTYNMPTDKEPKMNLLCSYQEEIWRLIIFPRSKHRPDVYFKKDDEQILVSPASIDMGGIIITPKEKDFNTLDAKAIETIYTEVSEKAEYFEQILKTLL